jgi:hypothetical protein
VYPLIIQSAVIDEGIDRVVAIPILGLSALPSLCANSAEILEKLRGVPGTAQKQRIASPGARNIQKLPLGVVDVL